MVCSAHPTSEDPEQRPTSPMASQPQKKYSSEHVCLDTAADKPCKPTRNIPQTRIRLRSDAPVHCVACMASCRCHAPDSRSVRSRIRSSYQHRGPTRLWRSRTPWLHMAATLDTWCTTNETKHRCCSCGCIWHMRGAPAEPEHARDARALTRTFASLRTSRSVLTPRTTETILACTLASAELS